MSDHGNGLVDYHLPHYGAVIDPNEEEWCRSLNDAGSTACRFCLKFKACLEFPDFRGRFK